MPERLPPAILMDLKEQLLKKFSDQYAAQAAFIKNYITERAQMNEFFKTLTFKVEPQIIWFLPDAKNVPPHIPTSTIPQDAPVPTDEANAGAATPSADAA